MGQVAIDELLKRCGSIYKLTILAAQRAKELAEGAPPLIDTPTRKVTTIALEEILEGKVLYQPEEPEEGAKKKGRAAKGKADKKRA